MQLQEAYIVKAKRTAVGKARGVFSQTRPDDMLAHVIKTILSEIPDLPPAEIDDVIIGCAMPEAEQGWNVGRIAALLAGLPESVPGFTVNRLCSSGLQSIALAADKIKTGVSDVIIAGGTESMSMIPIAGNKPALNPGIFDDENRAIAFGMGMTAEKVAQKWRVDRQMQDKFALESHKRSVAAIEQGKFHDEIINFNAVKSGFNLNEDKAFTTTITVDTDEGPRKDSSLELLGKLRTVFAKDGSVTAGNSSQMSDGAAALIICSEKALKKYNLQPMARFISFSAAGVKPEFMGIGPVKAIPKALKLAGLKQDDLEWIELNEAFAAQSVAVIQELNLDPDKVNPLGGAISLGHPLGATGSIRAATLLNGMQRNKMKYGMVTMCVGVGMGAAGIFEAL